MHADLCAHVVVCSLTFWSLVTAWWSVQNSQLSEPANIHNLFAELLALQKEPDLELLGHHTSVLICVVVDDVYSMLSLVNLAMSGKEMYGHWKGFTAPPCGQTSVVNACFMCVKFLHRRAATLGSTT